MISGHEIQISFISHLYCLHLYSQQEEQHHTGRQGILKLGLKLAAGYFQFGSDYLGEGGMTGQFTSPTGLNGHSAYSRDEYYISSNSIKSAELDDTECTWLQGKSEEEMVPFHLCVCFILIKLEFFCFCSNLTWVCQLLKD